MGSRQIVLVSTAGFSFLNTGIFWREAKTKRLFSQCMNWTAPSGLAAPGSIQLLLVEQLLTAGQPLPTAWASPMNWTALLAGYFLIIRLLGWHSYMLGRSRTSCACEAPTKKAGAAPTSWAAPASGVVSWSASP